MQLDLAHLKRGRMPVAHQIADQALVVLHMLGPCPIADPRRLHDGSIIAHIVDDADKAVVQNRVGAVKMRLHPVADRAQCGARRGALCVDFGDLVRGQRNCLQFLFGLV